MIVVKLGEVSLSSKNNIEEIKPILDQKKENYIAITPAFSGVTDLLEHISESAIKGDVSILTEEFKSIHSNIVKDIFSPSQQTDVLLEVQQLCDKLEAICNGINVLKEVSPRTKAMILSFGEQLAAIILYKYLISQGVAIALLESQNLIIANGDYLDGEVDFDSTNKNIASVVANQNYIAAGFIASNNKNEPVRLGENGADYSASIFASAINANSLEIWSDINGIYCADPQKVKNAKIIEELSYQEAFELVYFGAKVVHPSAVIPAMNKKIPLYLKNSLQPKQKGTLISIESSDNNDTIKGVSSLDNISIITVSGVGLANQKGEARKVFQALEECGINIILITQSSSEQSIGIGIHQDDIKAAEEAINIAFEKEISKGSINEISITKDQCIIALVGDNMKHKVGLCGKIFGAIGENGINITAIAQGASERNISIVIDQREETKALNVIHEKFFNNTIKNVHLFIAGIGNVGNEFLNIIEAQKKTLIDEYNINLKITGVANSQRILINETGELSSKNIALLNKEGKSYDSFSDYLSVVNTLNLANSVFIDNTASKIVSDSYSSFLKSSISVVTCNKIACSGEYEYYALLKKLAKDFNCHFKYETSVGAALPIIKTIHDLNISGDKINKIETVISGSLNFIFNEYNGDKLFSDVVLQAKEEGYTEPNPLIDLSGLDVMRKILILSREAGYVNEISNIDFDSFLPEDCENAESNEDLFKSLEENEAHFKSLYTTADKKGDKLKVLASMDKGRMSVSLKEIPSHSPFYNLEGKDNVVAINTHRYNSEPLVIKGAGAGASVTASGVFADLMFIINR